MVGGGGGALTCFEEWKDIPLAAQNQLVSHLQLMSPVRYSCCNQFQYLKKPEIIIHLLIGSFSTYIERSFDNVQVELTDLKSDKRLKKKSNSVKCGCCVILNSAV
jgi:hypothetical protein